MFRPSHEVPRVELSLEPNSQGEVRRLEHGDPGPPRVGRTGPRTRNGFNQWAGKEGEVKSKRSPKEKS